LKSQAGRWDPNSQTWVRDDVTSPCIDAGDPNSPIGYEPFPNGGIVNMGAYGGTTEASKSASAGSIVGWGLDRYGEVAPPEGGDFVAIAAGDAHSLALKSDGSLVGWGTGCSPPPDGNDFVAIAAGGRDPQTLRIMGYSLGLKSDGSILRWGVDEHFVHSAPPDGNDFVAIAAGGGQSLALKADGSIVGWGNNSSGKATPPDGNDYVAIAAGTAHSLALKADGSVVGWGLNHRGQAAPPDDNESQMAPLSAGGTTIMGRPRLPTATTLWR
jgi:alpha-tubulin suppressor-like RCC1 family protein